VLEQPGNGVAERSASTAGGGHRSGGVGADELDEDALRPLGGARPEALAETEQLRDRVAVPAVGEEDVEEAGAGDLDPLRARAEDPVELGPEPLGDLAPAAGARSMAALVE
jgi:hypothetical protein